ncbi:MAG: hypothetical protein AAF416_14430 [Pseudomonadota bacterium]
MTVVQIEQINRATGLVVFADNTIGQVLNWIDDDGDDCEPEEAVICVVENESRRGVFWTIDISRFVSATLH